jgi:hypothetical protein
MENRIDRLTAVYVDLAVNIVGSHGLAAGVRALLECGTAPAVIQRVLVDVKPCRRATSAWPEPSSHDEQRTPHTGAAAQ